MSEEIQKYGTDNLKKIIKEGVELAIVTKEQLSDGFQWLTDTIAISTEAKDLISINWKQVDDEFKDLTTSEVEEIVIYLVEQLGIVKEKVINLINASLDFLKSGYNLYLAIDDLK